MFIVGTIDSKNDENVSLLLSFLDSSCERKSERHPGNPKP